MAVKTFTSITVQGHFEKDEKGRRVLMGHRADPGTARWNKRTLPRIYVHFNDEAVKALAGEAPKWSTKCPKKGKPGHSEAICGSCENDRKWAAYNRAETKVGKAEALAVLKDLGIEGVAVKFSRTAGCSCGCSPAFIVQEQLRTAGGSLIGDIWQ